MCFPISLCLYYLHEPFVYPIPQAFSVTNHMHINRMCKYNHCSSCLRAVTNTLTIYCMHHFVGVLLVLTLARIGMPLKTLHEYLNITELYSINAHSRH